MPRKKMGRPKGPKRNRLTIHVKPTVQRQIDAEIDGVKTSRGKVIESKFEKGFTLIEVLIVLTILAIIALLPIAAYMESETYNKLTGAHTTWWDALWVELRVQDAPQH